MSSIGIIKEQKRTIIRRHAQPDDVKGLTQVLTTLASLALFWWVAVLSVGKKKDGRQPELNGEFLLLFGALSTCFHTSFHNANRSPRLGRCPTRPSTISSGPVTNDVSQLARKTTNSLLTSAARHVQGVLF